VLQSSRLPVSLAGRSQAQPTSSQHRDAETGARENTGTKDFHADRPVPGRLSLLIEQVNALEPKCEALSDEAQSEDRRMAKRAMGR
jgi:hypothetical protein